MKSLRTFSLAVFAAVWLTGSAGPVKEPELEILTPGQGAEVERDTTIQGRVSDPRVPVVVLVRPLTTRFWWVQRIPAPANRDGSWETLASFGESKRGVGEEFQIIALVTEERLVEGDMLDTLPRHSARSDIVKVRRTR